MKTKPIKKQSSGKHIPIRTCIGTGIKLPKKELIRIVNVKENIDNIEIEHVRIDLRDKLSGRGASLFPNMEALEKALKINAFSRAFKRKLRTDEIEYLKNEFQKAVDEKNFRPNNKSVTLRLDK